MSFRAKQSEAKNLENTHVDGIEILRFALTSC